MAFQVTPPEPFIFARPEEWLKWIRRFERFRLATGLETKSEEKQISTLNTVWGTTRMTSFVLFAYRRRIQRSTNGPK